MPATRFRLSFRTLYRQRCASRRTRFSSRSKRMESEVGMSSSESPELIRLFHTYTGASSSIGAHLGALAARSTASAPLIVATGTDLVLYPGDGATPTVEPFRMSTRGFKELAAVSHLGP